MQTASHIYEIILALLPAIALMWRGGVFGGGYNGKDMFAYYTNLSNLLVCVYFALRCIFRAVGIDFARGLLFSATSQFAVTLGITATFVIYHFILRPAVEKNKEEFEEFSHFYTPTNILVHYVVPLLTLVYWFVFADKEGLGVGSVFAWVCLPLLYSVYAFVRAPFKGNIYKTESPYPYEFMDPYAIGWKMVLKCMGLLTVIFIAVGFVFLFIAKLIVKL